MPTLHSAARATAGGPCKVGIAHHCLMSIVSVIGLFNVSSLDRSGGYPIAWVGSVS